MSDISAIAKRLDGIAFLTEDEWLVYEDEDVEEYEVYAPHPHPNARTVICKPEQNRDLADFLRAAPEDIRWLLDRVRELELREAGLDPETLEFVE